MDYVNVNVLVVIVLLNFTKRGNGTKYKGMIISYDCILIYNYLQRNFSFKKTNARTSNYWLEEDQ